MIKYLPTHEYIRYEEGQTQAYIGVSPYAAQQLGNVVYVEAPMEGDEFAAGEAFGAIESVKAASDLFAPVACTIIEENQEVIDNPRLINNDAMEAWIVKVEILDSAQLDSLLTPEEYEKLTQH